MHVKCEILFFVKVLHMWDGDSIVSMLTYSGLDGLRFETWQGQDIFFYLKPSRLAPKPTQQSSQSVKLTTHLYMLPRLGVSRVEPLFPLFAFMVWTGTTLPLPLHL
jgi:hypothetical protein